MKGKIKPKSAGDALRGSELKFRSFFEQSAEGICLVDEDGSIIDWNKAMERITGLASEKALGQHSWDIMYQFNPPEQQTPERYEILKNNILKMLRNDHSPFFRQTVEVSFLAANCEKKYIHQTVFPIRTERGCRLGFIFFDITENKLAESLKQAALEALRESEERYRRLFNGATLGIFQSTKEGKLLLVNPAFARIYGYDSPEDVLECVKDVSQDFYVDPPERGNIIATLKKEGGVITTENIYKRKDGSTFTGRLSLWEVNNEQGQHLYLEGIVADITERIKTEEALQRETQRLKILAGTATRLNAELELDTLLKTVCEEAARAFGAPAADIILVDEQNQEVRLAASFGFPPEYQQGHKPTPLAVFDSYTARWGDAVILPDVRAVSGLLNSELYIQHNVRTILAASMYHSQKLLGTLNVFTIGEVRQFNEEELTLLKGMAAQAAQVVVNARLFEQVSAGRKHLRALSQALIEAHEAERRSMALELHDELGQVLNGIKITLDMMPRLTDDTTRAFLLNEARSAIGSLIGRVRQLSLDLRPSLLDEMGLLPTLKWLFRTYQEQNGAAVRFEYTVAEQRYPPAVEITAYRIIQEGLNNISRHAADKQAAVNLWVEKNILYIQVVDMGGGFDTQKALGEGKSTGLSGMRERARLLGGELVIESEAGKGTSISASLPLEAIQQSGGEGGEL